MKFKFLSYIALGVAAASLASSCQESWAPSNERTGQLSLSSLGIQIDSSVSTTSTDVRKSKESREEASTYDVSEFLIRVYDSQNAMVANWRFAEMPDIFTLPVGKNYRLDIVSHEVQKADWAKPLYVGSATFDINDSQITDIGKVICKFSSLKVSVEFSPELKKAMGADARVRVVTNDVGELIFTATETRAGFFEVLKGSNTLAYYFEGSVNGTNEEFHNIYTDVIAGQHRIIKFSLKTNNTQPDEETGSINPGSGINVNVDVIDEDMQSNASPSEDPEHPKRPDEEEWPENPDDPVKPDDPVTNGEITFTSNLSFEEEMNPLEEPDGVVNVYVEKGIRNFVVTITPGSADFKNVLNDVNVPLVFDIANPTEADEGVMGLLGSDGEPLESVKNKTDVRFDITGFLSLLNIYGGTHKFMLVVTDNDGYSESRTLTFKVVK